MSVAYDPEVQLIDLGTGGRPPLLIKDTMATARKLYEQQDMTIAQIEEVFGVSRTTIYRTLGCDSNFTLFHRCQTKNVGRSFCAQGATRIVT